VLDDVAHSGEHILIEQCVAHERAGHVGELPESTPRTPLVRHDIGTPVVQVVYLSFELSDGAAVEIDLPVGEHQRQPRTPPLATVDHVAAEHQKMDAQGDIAEIDQEMLAPGPKACSPTHQAAYAHLGIAPRSQNFLTL